MVVAQMRTRGKFVRHASSKRKYLILIGILIRAFDRLACGLGSRNYPGYACLLDLTPSHLSLFRQKKGGSKATFSTCLASGRFIDQSGYSEVTRTSTAVAAAADFGEDIGCRIVQIRLHRDRGRRSDQHTWTAQTPLPACQPGLRPAPKSV